MATDATAGRGRVWARRARAAATEAPLGPEAPAGARARVARADPNVRTPPTPMPRAPRKAGPPPPAAGAVRHPRAVPPAAPTPRAPATRDARTPARRTRAARDRTRARRPATSTAHAEPTTPIVGVETTSPGRRGPKAREALGLPPSDRPAREKARSRKAEKPLPGAQCEANARRRLRTAPGSGTAPCSGTVRAVQVLPASRAAAP